MQDYKDLIEKQVKEFVESTQYNLYYIEDVTTEVLDVMGTYTFENKRHMYEVVASLFADRIDIDKSDLTYVAANIFLGVIHEEIQSVDKRLNGFEFYLDYGVKDGKIIDGMKEVYETHTHLGKRGLDYLEEKITTNNDTMFTYLGIRTLYDRYLIKNSEGKCIEYPQYAFMSIAMFLAHKEKQPVIWAEKFYGVLSNLEAMSATPTLSNGRKPRSQLSSCFKANEQITTSKGYKSIKDVVVGDQVVTHENRVREVYELMQREYEGYYHTLNCMGNTSLSATEEHPVFSVKYKDIMCIRGTVSCLDKQGSYYLCNPVKKEYRNACEGLSRDFKDVAKWIPIKDLNKGDYINKPFDSFTHEEECIMIHDLVPQHGVIIEDGKIIHKKTPRSRAHMSRGYYNEQITPIKNEIPLNDELFLLLGYFLAEGHVLKNEMGICFTYNSKYTRIHEDTKRILKNLFGVDAKQKINKDNSTNITVHSKVLGSLFKELTGTGFNNKRLHYLLKYAKPEIQLNLLIGVIRGDGCMTKVGNTLQLSNIVLIEELEKIALRNKLHPLINYNQHIHKLSTTPVATLYFTVREDGEFIKLIDKDLDKIEYSRLTSNVRATRIWVDGKYFIGIKSVTKEMIKETVYNIEVEEDHSYVINGFGVHNCYVGKSPDNIEGITDSYSSVAMLSKFGGGLGWDWTSIRGGNSSIDGHKNAAGGIVPFMHILNATILAFNQLGTRVGAIAAYMQPWHMDIESFIDLKQQSGEYRRRAHDIFPALWIDDLFMERVEQDGDWTLFDPADVVGLENLHGENFTKQYEEYEQQGLGKQVMKAKDLWKYILSSYTKTGTPFLGFKTEANRRNANKHVGTINSSNLCVTGDTRISTQYGLVTVKELYENQLPLTCDFDNRSGSKDLGDIGVGNTSDCLPMHKTGKDSDVYEVMLENGMSLESTLYHEYDRKTSEGVERVKMSSLTLDDSLLIQSGISQFGKTPLWNEVSYYVQGHPDRVPNVIFETNMENVKTYLKLVMEYHVEGEELLTIEHGEYLFVKDVQTLLISFGIKSTISMGDEGAYVLKIDEDCKALYEYRILGEGEEVSVSDIDYSSKIVSLCYIGKEDVYDTTQFVNHSVIFNGIPTSQCTEIFNNTAAKTYDIKVTLENGIEQIYKETDKVTTSLTIDGKRVLKQASKLAQIDYLCEFENKGTPLTEGYKIVSVETVSEDGETAICNLMSINLSRVKTKEDLERVVPIAIRMLDNVIDNNYYPLMEVKKTAEKYRAIGLGIMGEAQMLAEEQIMYGSPQHFDRIDEIMEIFSYNAIKASTDLAVERGTYKVFEGSNWSKGILPIDTANEQACALTNREPVYDWGWLRKRVKDKGMRNGYLMAIAPTSSISILTGTTQAVEPVYKKFFYEENKTGTIPVVAPNLNPDTWAYYIGAYDLDQKRLVKVAAIRQKWLDQGQSLNIFLSLSILTGKLMNDIYMLGYKLGLKSFYYLRTESATVETIEVNGRNKEIEVMDRTTECVGCQ